MAKVSKIEWLRGADGKPGASFNPWIGCHWVSPACDHCYGEAWAHHYKRDFTKVTRTHSTTFNGPKTWREPRRVFVCSLSDFFHVDVTRFDRHAAIHVMRDAPQHTYVLLTKRPENIKPMLLGTAWGDAGLPDNVWLGVTAENQEQADKRIPLLLAVPAKVHFVSCEPLLGPLDLTPWLYKTINEFNITSTGLCVDGNTVSIAGNAKTTPRLDWIIAGGESGNRARPMHPAWARGLRDQCAEAGVPYMHKQNGEYIAEPAPLSTYTDGSPVPLTDEPVTFKRVGKKAAGRLLDGVIHDGFPQ